MKLIIKEKLPTTLSLDPKHKPKYETVSTTVEIPDEMLKKTIAVIDEILDRTWDDLENISSSRLEFPLVPFPFFHKYREPDREGVDDYWISYWLGTGLSDIIKQRHEIIENLGKLDCLSIEKNPVINIITGHFEGDKFSLTLDRKRLIDTRDKLVKGLKTEKQKSEIDLDSLDFPQALYILRVLYSKIIEILEAVCRNYVLVRNTELNFYYTNFCVSVESILNLGGFEKLKEQAPNYTKALLVI